MGRQSPREKVARKALTKNNASSITASRTNAIEQMNAALRRRFTLVEKSVNDLRAENLRYYHKIGVICEEIRQNPADYIGKDGTAGLRLIEQALSTQARTLRKAAMFAREYDADQLDGLLGLINTETKFQLHWGHVSFLLTLPTAEKREKFAAEAVQKMLDPPALHDLIKKRLHKSAGHGRKHEMPKTIGGQIRQILTISRQWTAKNTNVWNGVEASVYGNIMNMPPDDMEPDMVDQLTEVEALMQEIATAANENIDRTKRAREHLTNSIERRNAETETGRQTRAIDLEGGNTSRRRGSRSAVAASS